MKRIVVILALACFVAAAHPAAASTPNVSYSTWTISPDKIGLKIVLPIPAAQRLTGTKIPLATINKLEDYLLKRTGVRTGGGEKCPAMDQGYDLGRVDPLHVASGYYGYEIFFKCPAHADAFVFENHVLFDIDPRHVDFARIESSRGRFVPQVFTAGRQALRVPAAGPVPAATKGQFAYLGFMHVRGSLDRLCLLLGLLLLMRRKRDLGYVAGGLLAGYALSLATTATGLFMPRATLLEAFIGFLVALAAAELAAREADRSKIALAGSLGLGALAVVAAFTFGTWPALVLLGAMLLTGGFLIASRDVPAWPVYSLPALGVILGYLDGFVLPESLTPMTLPGRTLAWMAAAFDFGALLTSIAVLALLGGVLLLLRRRKPVLPAPLVHDFAAACLGGLGVFWLLTRL